MNTITKIVVLLSLCFMTSQMNAQDTIQNTDKTSKIKTLEDLKTAIQNEERELLKAEVEAINQRLDNGTITENEAENLKKEAAKKRALNIENRLAIIDNKIALLQRNGNDIDVDTDNGSEYVIRFGVDAGDDDNDFFFIGKKNKPKKYDKRTTNALIFASGFNNAITEGQSFSKSPYSIAESGFIEFGFAWKTRLLEDSNFLRLQYGFSFQWNKLNAKDNLYFEQTGNTTTLEQFPVDLSESEIRFTNLVLPLHLEFGPSKKIERDTYFRYSTYKKFKMGIGGYAGFNIGTQQKLRYKEDGDRVKQKIRKDYNATDFVYGLSSYIGYGDLSLYVKYDLSPTFKDQEVEQNNISLGLRFEL